MSKTILVVDDSDTTRKLISYMVKGIGYKTVGAVNGLDALEKLARNDIALVLTDLNMPQMDGLELAKSIREDDNYKEIPIIMISTESRDEARKKGIEAGVNRYLTKPVTSKRLGYQIEKLL